MKLIFTFFLMLGASLQVDAVEVEVGHRLINVPLPDGFVELTPQMSPYYETMRAYVASSNVRYLTLITANKAEALLRGEQVELFRYINVESEKGMSTSSISSDQFAELRNILRDQLDELCANIDKQLPGIVDKGNAIVSEKFDIDIAVELGGIVSLPIHLDTDSAMANSVFMTVGATVDGENTATRVQAETTLFLHVKDKVLFLYIYGPESDLDWTRKVAASWATNIIAANPLSTDEKRAVEQPGPFGIKWNKVLEKALIGALAGGVIALFVTSYRRRKKE